MDLKTIKGGAIVFGLVLFAVMVGLAIYHKVTKKNEDEINIVASPQSTNIETEA